LLPLLLSSKLPLKPLLLLALLLLLVLLLVLLLLLALVALVVLAVLVLFLSLHLFKVPLGKLVPKKLSHGKMYNKASISCSST
jgi:hypothetical protein